MDQLQHTEPESPASHLRPMSLALGLAAGLAAVAFRVLPLLVDKAAAGVVLPALWNLTPIGAIALFGGARLRLWQALLLPYSVLIGTDLVLWAIRGDQPFDPFVYASYAIYVLIGRALQRTESPLWIGCGGLAGCLQFFVISNLGYWLGGANGYSLAGLSKTYVDAIPFFRGTFLGDLAYIPLLFGAHALLTRLAFPAERVRAEAHRPA